MKSAMLFLSLFAVCAFVLPVVLTAQVPDWENAVTLQSTDYVTCAISDGYGQHVLIPNGSAFIHRLLGNDGVKITSNSEQVTPPRGGGDADFGASLATFGGVVSIVARNSTTQLYLYQSANGGANWSSAITYTPPSGVSLNNVDAFVDGRGVHIVWDNTAGTKAYYVRYEPPPANQFVGIQEVTDLNGTIIQAYRPKVVTSANKVIVSFVRKDAGTYYVGSSRDYDFTTSSWDNSDRAGAQLAKSVLNQSICIRGASIHMVMRRAFNGTNPPDYSSLYTMDRQISSGDWSSPLRLIQPGYSGNESDFRRLVTVVGDTAYALYSKSIQLEDKGLKFLYYKPSDPWPQTSYFTISDYATSAIEKETISSSRTGVYSYYDSTTNATKMRRKGDCTFRRHNREHVLHGQQLDHR